MGERGDTWGTGHRCASPIYKCQFSQPQRRIPRFVNNTFYPLLSVVLKSSSLLLILPIPGCLFGCASCTVSVQQYKKEPCMLCETVGMTTPAHILSSDWSTRVKQIAKLWRKASSQDRAPYVVRSLTFFADVL